MFMSVHTVESKFEWQAVQNMANIEQDAIERQKADDKAAKADRDAGSS